MYEISFLCGSEKHKGNVSEPVKSKCNTWKKERYVKSESISRLYFNLKRKWFNNDRIGAKVQ